MLSICSRCLDCAFAEAGDHAGGDGAFGGCTEAPSHAHPVLRKGSIGKFSKLDKVDPL